MRRWLPALASLGLLACAITQEVEPVESTPTPEVCIVENPAVRKGFLSEYEATLRERGYEVRVLPEGSPLEACTVSSTYLATWEWDVALYMDYAEIEVYVDGELAGRAVYDSRGGSGNLGKFIDAKPKIRELVSRLYPIRPQAPTADGGG